MAENKPEWRSLLLLAGEEPLRIRRLHDRLDGDAEPVLDHDDLGQRDDLIVGEQFNVIVDFAVEFDDSATAEFQYLADRHDRGPENRGHLKIDFEDALHDALRAIPGYASTLIDAISHA